MEFAPMLFRLTEAVALCDRKRLGRRGNKRSRMIGHWQEQTSTMKGSTTRCAMYKRSQDAYFEVWDGINYEGGRCAEVCFCRDLTA